MNIQIKVAMIGGISCFFIGFGLEQAAWDSPLGSLTIPDYLEYLTVNAFSWFTGGSVIGWLIGTMIYPDQQNKQ
jgi:hypothetical protein